MQCSNIAILFLTNKASPQYLEKYATIKNALIGKADVYLLFHLHEKDPVPEEIKLNNGYVFSYKSLAKLRYHAIAASLIPGSNHFPLFQFFHEHPGYAYYWYIEDDVSFNGDWEYLFSHFKTHPQDFLSAHIRYYNEEPEWYWWFTLRHPEEGISQEEMIRSFNPIYRLSAGALRFIDHALCNGWKGHHEVLMPTLLYHNGFSLLDFGGNGKFVLSGEENRFYISENFSIKGGMGEGTMRFRPVWEQMGDEKGKIYHPVKCQ